MLSRLFKRVIAAGLVASLVASATQPGGCSPTAQWRADPFALTRLTPLPIFQSQALAALARQFASNPATADQYRLEAAGRGLTNPPPNVPGTVSWARAILRRLIADQFSQFPPEAEMTRKVGINDSQTNRKPGLIVWLNPTNSKAADHWLPLLWGPRDPETGRLTGAPLNRLASTLQEEVGQAYSVRVHAGDFRKDCNALIDRQINTGIRNAQSNQTTSIPLYGSEIGDAFVLVKKALARAPRKCTFIMPKDRVGYRPRELPYDDPLTGQKETMQVEELLIVPYNPRQVRPGEGRPPAAVRPSAVASSPTAKQVEDYFRANPFIEVQPGGMNGMRTVVLVKASIRIDGGEFTLKGYIPHSMAGDYRRSDALFAQLAAMGAVWVEAVSPIRDSIKHEDHTGAVRVVFRVLSEEMREKQIRRKKEGDALPSHRFPSGAQIESAALVMGPGKILMTQTERDELKRQGRDWDDADAVGVAPGGPAWSYGTVY